MIRLLPWLAFASALLPSVSSAQSRDVETVTDQGPDPRHPTATVSRVTIDPARGEDLATAVDAVPGVHSRRTSFGQTAYATVRGSNARQVSVEYEGLRLTPPFGPGFDLGGLALGVDAVSVWRGAAATYRGSGALAGALELHTVHPRRPGSLLKASVLRGSHDTWAGELGATVATRDVSTRVGVGGRRSDGDFVFTDAQGAESRRVNNDHQRGAAFGATELRLDRTWLRAAVLHDQGERGTPGLSEFQQQFEQARLDDAQTALVLGVGGRDIVRSTSWSVDGAMRAGAQRRRYEYTNTAPFLGGEPIREDTRSNTVTTVGDVTAWGPTSVARTAVDLRYDDWRSDVDTARVSTGLGASWEQAVGDVVLVGAGRVEADSDGRAAVLPAVGAQWAPTEDWIARANVGRTFRAPNLDELYLELESVRGNPDLVSEIAWLADIGATFEGELWGAGLTAFGRIVDEEILFLPVNAYLVEAQNISGTYAAGAEAEATVSARPFRGRVGYTYTFARFRETNTRVPLQPEHAADAEISVEPVDWLRVWTGGTLRGSITLDPFGNAKDGAHAFWNAGCSFGDDPATLSFVARNLLDDNRAVDAVQQPMPGRTLWASLELRWDQEPR